MAERITKKDLKKPDQLQTTTEKLLHYARENMQKIIVGSAVCVAVIALLSGWYIYSHFNERKAQELFGYAISMTASNPAAGQAVAMMEIEKLREVVSKYPNTDAANLSRYTLGAVYLKVNDIDNSIKFYEEFIAKSGGSELKALAYNGLGYGHEAKGDFAGAFKYFEEAAKSPEGAAFRGAAYLNAGRAAEQLKDRQKALDSYKKALESKNDSMTEMFLKRKISELE